MTEIAAQVPAGPGDSVAVRLVDLLVRGEYSAVEGMFDSTMAHALPEAKLQATWEALVDQVGTFQKQTGIRTQQAHAFQTVIVSTEFERASLDFRVVLDSAFKVRGFFIQPAAPTGDAALPPYAPPAGSYRERGE